MYRPTLLSFHLGYRHLFSENEETQMPTAKIEWTKCPRIPLETSDSGDEIQHHLLWIRWTGLMQRIPKSPVDYELLREDVGSDFPLNLKFLTDEWRHHAMC